ncbi:3'(2'),5'-bisphosphate nucleotidase CysQ [Sphingomonas bacterium]|uniref:3'(2'),5'-bisphosphate nucleotidase CysQ n=1 Tax=Sphingomonas bacterium TaxID=1895847 RepID=UPI00261445FA|nr:3'(2'),5'-bisphosphate nucleotidase CysQ [Sphingomonas bacterium]MDB5678153.1 3(2),5-bisphosphate nucleotidase CysQ [Sphingomonas bacterium]
MTDGDLAALLAGEAGELLQASRSRLMFRDEGSKEIGMRGDAKANNYLCKMLGRLRPDDGLLSEERKCDGTRMAKSRVWIIDPVDGTREYGEARDDWAVHVALCVDGAPVLGAVALPDAGLVLRSDAPPALQPLNDPPRMVVSRTRPAAEAVAVAAAIGADLVPMGSAGAKAMAVVRGIADIYLHSGGQHEWDSAAPVAVALAAGLHCARLDGTPLVYNCDDTYVHDLLICRKELVGAVMKALVASAPSPRT